jgi:hypothetical protein
MDETAIDQLQIHQTRQPVASTIPDRDRRRRGLDARVAQRTETLAQRVLVRHGVRVERDDKIGRFVAQGVHLRPPLSLVRLPMPPYEPMPVRLERPRAPVVDYVDDVGHHASRQERFDACAKGAGVFVVGRNHRDDSSLRGLACPPILAPARESEHPHQHARRK